MRQRKLLVTIAFLLSILFFNSGYIYAAEGSPYAEQAWTANFPKDIVWQQLTDAGYLVVCTEEGLYGIDPTSGATAWKMDDIKDIPEDFF